MCNLRQVTANPLGNVKFEHAETNMLFKLQQDRFGKTIFLLENIATISQKCQIVYPVFY